VDQHKIVQLSTGDMLRSAVQAKTPIGLKAKDIMARGELVPDAVVVAIVGDRIDQPDAKNGFILDGFPRTVPQAEALDTMLADKGLKLDSVIQLKVDENALLGRIAKRAAEMQARGEPVRADDNPEALKKRLAAYHAQTAPLAAYYAHKGELSRVNGMESIPRVAVAIDKILGGGRGKPSRKPPKARDGDRAKAKPKLKAKPVKKAAKTAIAKRKASSGARSKASGRKTPSRKGVGRKPSRQRS
jgi:adenylate kinase